MKLDLSTIFKTSEDAPIRHPLQVLANLTEEVGELSVCVNRPEKATEPLVGEAADVINCAIDIVWLDFMHSPDANGLTTEQCNEEIVKRLNEQIKKKCSKWRRSFEEQK